MKDLATLKKLIEKDKNRTITINEQVQYGEWLALCTLYNELTEACFISMPYWGELNDGEKSHVEGQIRVYYKLRANSTFVNEMLDIMFNENSNSAYQKLINVISKLRWRRTK